MGHPVEEPVSAPRLGRSIDHRRNGGDPRLFNIVEKQLGGAKDIKPRELEIGPGRPAIGVTLEQVDLGGKHVGERGSACFSSKSRDYLDPGIRS